MIKELVELGKRVRNGGDDALKMEPYSIDLVIDVQGNFKRFLVGERRETLTESIAAKKGKARLLLDKGEEVLGLVKEKSQDDKKGNVYFDIEQTKHKLFIEKLAEYKDVAELSPIRAFYEDAYKQGLTEAQKHFVTDVDEKLQGENITFMVDDERLVQLPAVIDAIKRHYESKQCSLHTSAERCSICGRTKYPVVDAPHGMIKRVPDGQPSGCALVSYNTNAFESYGLRGNENSAICTACARNYVEAMNYLLSNGHEAVGESSEKTKKRFVYTNRHKINEGTAALFWTAEPTDDVDPFTAFDSPSEQLVQDLFNSVAAGRDMANVVDNNMFYCLTISGAAARIAVRDWIAISIEQYKQHLSSWFADIAIDNRGEIEYCSFYKLLMAIRGKNKDSEQEGKIGSLLWNAALKNEPIPLSVLVAVMHRLSVSGQQCTQAQAALIKLILNRNNNSKKMTPTLDETNTSVAYLCGRLFAVIERIQQQAMGNVNSGIRDRFFASAAAMPSAIFGRLLTGLTQNHLSKLQKVNTGSYIYFNKLISDIMSDIQELPERLTLVEQGQFALGYYHQTNNFFTKKQTEENNQ